MKLLISNVLLLSTLALVAFGEDTLESCSCWEEYKPAMVNNQPMCVGIRLMALKPCNIPRAPLCKCDPAEVTGITTDANGTRCSKYVKGVEVKSWPCENQEEWEAFNKQMADKPHH